MRILWISEQIAVIFLYAESRIAKGKSRPKKKSSFTSKLGLYLRKKLVKYLHLEHNIVW
jgi:hypothetical protein